MTQLLEWLAEGDLRSDGVADEVTHIVLQDRRLLEELLAGLDDRDDVVRGHAAHALEKVSRLRPDWLFDHLPHLCERAKRDSVPMVRWHLAMLLGNLSVNDRAREQCTPVLLHMLQDRNIFVKSWAISSLCIVVRMDPSKRSLVVSNLSPLRTHPSTAIRARVRMALDVLTVDDLPLPKSWVKSDHLIPLLKRLWEKPGNKGLRS